MASTLENINNNIISRIDSVNGILTFYSEYELSESDEKQLNNGLEKMKEIYDNYMSSTINVVKEYFNATDDSVKKELYTKFIKAFHTNNIVGGIKRQYQFCKKLKKNYPIDDDELNTMFRTYENTSVEEKYDDQVTGICPVCKIAYDIEERTSEFTCRNCGKIEKIYGIVFENEQFFYQEGGRTKHGKYVSIKHCKYWIDRIQAKESSDIPEKVINAIKRCILRDKIWIDKVTCPCIRKYLKQLKLTTQYNNHVPLIRKIITGQEPPQFSGYELKLIHMKFLNVIQIFNKIKPADISNCFYHPYFIYKIIEQILNKPSDAKRKAEILSCIHLQSRETLIEKDIIWFIICDHIPEFTKIPTKLRD